MTKAYDQHCPIAMALDVVGERWSLLVVRELMLGPLRFGEIASGLPGVGSKQLSERLKSLTEMKVIEPIDAEPGVGFAHYRLTSQGRALAPSLEALAVWGSPILYASSPSNPPSGTSLALMMWARSQQRGGELRGIVEVRLSGQPYTFMFSQEGVLATRGEPPADPDVFISMHLQDASDVLEKRCTIKEARSRKDTRVVGRASNKFFLALFGSQLAFGDYRGAPRSPNNK
jgi:DNA-binding HxlR family transcriptional regulator